VRVCASGVWQHAAPSDSRCCISRWCACAVIRRVSLRACVRACNGIDGRDGPAVGIRRSAGAASREMRDPWNRTVTAADRSYHESPPRYANHTVPHHHRTTWTRHADVVVNVPHSFAKGPLLVVSASACVRARVCTLHTPQHRDGDDAPTTTTTTTTTTLLQLLLYIIFLLYVIQYNDDAGVHTPRSPRYHLETIVNYSEFIN